MKKQSYIIWVYATILLVGGMIGFIKAGSVASIISAGLFSFILFGCGYAIWKGSLVAYITAACMAAFLLAFFGYRFLMTYQSMPAGIITLLSILVLVSLLSRMNQIRAR